MRYYCNPIYVEDYPRGHGGESDRQQALDYRSLADPEVIRVGDEWYMYPTYALAWRSDDLVHWRYAPVSPADAGPAPTVLAYRGQYYLSGGDEPLHVADAPLGPFRALGCFRLPDGRTLKLRDTMLFADDDERVYLYWGLGDRGVFGAELCPGDLTQLLTEPVCLIPRDPDHEWERFGEFHQSLGRTYLEGAYMLKEHGRYYLVYSAPGTCFGTYCLAAYRSDAGPLEGFVCQKRNPILAGRQGLIRGPGHGSFTRAKDGSLWCFYTVTLCCDHKYERRIGLDPAYIDDHGDLYVDGPSAEPRPAPDEAAGGSFARQYPLTYRSPAYASSCAPGRDAIYAVDESMLTWWQPAPSDPAPTLRVLLRAWYAVSGVRVVWRDVGLDYARGRLPGAFRYVVEGLSRDGWRTLVDRSESTADVCCDFVQCPNCIVSEARLRVLGAPEGIAPGVIDLTAFGAFAADL